MYIGDPVGSYCNVVLVKGHGRNMATTTATKFATGDSSHDGTLLSEEYTVKALPGILDARDLTALFVLLLFFVTNVPNAVAGGAAGLTLWIVGGITFFIPCAVVTSQLGTIFPMEGGLYNWTHKAFGPYMAFFVAFCAWVPGPLLLLATSDLLVNYLQGLNSNWLLAPWQQGIALMVIVALAGIVALRRHRTVQNIVNVTAVVIVLIAFLIGVAGIVWLVKGNPSATAFSPASNWLITWSPWWNPFSGAGNFGLFGVITLGYLGVNIPLNMAGELRRGGRNGQNEQQVSRMIRQHLVWGVLIVIVGYLVVTFGVLVVEGQNASYVLYAMVTAVTAVMGKGMGIVVAIGIMLTIFVATVVYTNTFARWLLVGGIDKRLPTSVGRLNRNRVPANAIIFQTFAAILLVFLFFIVLPLLVGGSNSANLVLQVYFVGVGAATMLWAFATIFLFINVLKLYAINPDEFRKYSVAPVPVIMVCAGLGLISGLFAMVDTLFNSYIPPLIPNAQWWWIVGGVTLVIVIVAILISMVASSEAAWQDLNR